MTTEPATSVDILSEGFADFALDECEEFDRIGDRTVTAIKVGAQVFQGRVLGFGSSYKEGPHTGHIPGTKPVEQCSACRWADVAILQTVPDEGEPTYLLASMGKTEVPGEDQRLKTIWTPDAREVFLGLFVTRSKGPNANPKIPAPNAAAFRAAAVVDGVLAEILEENEELVPVPRPARPDVHF